MATPADALSLATAGIAAIAALGTAASGLVDASKAFWGGISNIGFRKIETALKPFAPALDGADGDWLTTIRANWINGVAKDDQKSAAKSLIRLGLSSTNAAGMAKAGHVDPDALEAVLRAIETGGELSPEQINLLGRFNGAIDAAMDGAFERADQQYRNAAKLASGVAAIGLALWGGALLPAGQFAASDATYAWPYPGFWRALLVGIIAVPLAPVAKDLTSSLQAAVAAVRSTKP
jgi:hypothetical protein